MFRLTVARKKSYDNEMSQDKSIEVIEWPHGEIYFV